MIVEHGNFSSCYAPSASIEEALARAERGGGVAWIGVLDGSLSEAEEIAVRLGLGRRIQVEVEQRLRSAKPARASVTVVERGVHVLLAGIGRDDEGVVKLAGELELFATPESVVVMAGGVSEEMRPPAIRKRIGPAVAESDTVRGGFVFGVVLAQILDMYEQLLDEVEDMTVELSEEVFADRDPEQLKRINRLSEPVHAAAVAMHPLERGLDQLVPRERIDMGISQARELRSEIIHLLSRLERLDALLSSARQSYFYLAQDEANRLMEEQADITRLLSGYAVLIAIPTIVFSLYGTNFDHIPLIDKPWGYGVMLAVTLVLCVVAWWRLRKAGWI